MIYLVLMITDDGAGDGDEALLPPRYLDNKLARHRLLNV